MVGRFRFYRFWFRSWFQFSDRSRFLEKLEPVPEKILQPILVPLLWRKLQQLFNMLIMAVLYLLYYCIVPPRFHVFFGTGTGRTGSQKTGSENQTGSENRFFKTFFIKIKTHHQSQNRVKIATHEHRHFQHEATTSKNGIRIKNKYASSKLC